MSQEGVKPTAVVGGDVSIAHELMEEDLQRELARHEAANRMAMERELEARAAKKRAEESQHMMAAMLTKYEDMRSKLDFTKKHLDETNDKITNQEALTDKISKMKERVEAYSTRKEAVEALNEHINLKQELHSSRLEVVKEGFEEEEIGEEESERLTTAKAGLKDHTERVERLKANMKANEETMVKREKLKVMLERQVAIEEKRTSEQTKIALAREKLLELKMKELTLQKSRLERKKREQEEKERATSDFMANIEAQLEDMESKAKAKKAEVAEIKKETGTVPKQEVPKKGKGKGKKSKSSTPKVMSPEPKTPKVMSPEPKTPKVMSPEPKTPKVMSPEPKTPKVMSPEPKTPKVMSPEPKTPKVMSPEPQAKSPEPEVVIKQKETKKTKAKAVEQKDNSATVNLAGVQEEKPEKGQLDAEMEKSERRQAILDKMAIIEQEKEEVPKDKMSEDEVKEMVKNVEGKCQSVRGDIADMAMSEQYLRTKQALLMAKKKEQEMKIATNIATIREEEVNKMREKVKQMQDLLSSRKQKLKITEEILVEKAEEKKNLDKDIDKMKRRENYVENEIIDRVIFEKEPPKKK